MDDKLAKIECETYTRDQELTLKNILQIAMACIETNPDLRPDISNVRDFIKFSNSSSFKMSHMSTISEISSEFEGKVDELNYLASLTMENTKPLKD